MLFANIKRWSYVNTNDVITMADCTITRIQILK